MLEIFFFQLKKDTKRVKKKSRVFEPKGDLLNFKANIDPMAMLIQARLSQVELSWVKLSQD